jgi:hypothetical protein
MKRLSVYFISIWLATGAFAQIEELTIEKDSILTERVFLLKAIWNPGFVYEQPISSLSTVRIDAGVWWSSGTNGWPRGVESPLYGGIYTDVELRHYFNLLRRTHNERRTSFNSGEYLVAGFAHYLPPSFSENKDLTENFANNFIFGVGVGHQRVFNWFFYDVSLQIGGHMLNQY